MRALTDNGCIACLGGAVLDVTYRATAPLVEGSSTAATFWQGPGGVARNIAETIARLGVTVKLCSVIGDDSDGVALRDACIAAGIDVGGMDCVPGAATARYAAVLDPDGALRYGFAAMAVLDRLDCAWLDRKRPSWEPAEFVFVDCNLAAEALASIIETCRRTGQRLAIDGVSVAKCQKLPADFSGVDILFVNRNEAVALIGGAGASALDLARALRDRGTAVAIVTCGGDGLAVATCDEAYHVPADAATVVDVTGAGDALVGGTLAAMKRGVPLRAALETGARIAALTVGRASRVAPELGPHLLPLP